MAAAYAGVANRGVFVKPTPFEEIRGPEGNVLWSRRVDGDRGRRALDSDVGRCDELDVPAGGVRWNRHCSKTG
jgi:membrane peptidoglycan carboxypeptidase